jgi:hypothetical protein
MTPMRLGDALREADEDPPPQIPLAPGGTSLCDNCFAYEMCAVAVAVRTVGQVIKINACALYLPIAEEDEPQ